MCVGQIPPAKITFDLPKSTPKKQMGFAFKTIKKSVPSFIMRDSQVGVVR